MSLSVLLTMGGTREHIDAARCITNISTGATGRAIAEGLALRGCRIICLCAHGIPKPSHPNITVEVFTTFRDLDAAIRRTIRTQYFDVVVHMAAVSDYSPVLIEAGKRRIRPGRSAKLDSYATNLKITLKRNFKILDRIKRYATSSGRHPPFLIGFKLTAGATPAQLRRKISMLAEADLVVHNDLSEIGERHPFHLYRDGQRFRDCEGPTALAQALYSVITEAKCC